MTSDAAGTPSWRRGLSGLLKHSAVRYVLAGGVAFLVDFGLLVLFKQLFMWPTWLAAGAAFIMSFAFTYTIQRYFSFGSDSPHGVALLKYTTLVIVNTVATGAIVAFLDHFGAGWMIGKVVATVVTTVWNYFAYRYWVFASPRSVSDD